MPQDEAANLFVDEISLAEVRLAGNAATNHAVSNLEIIPFQSDQLPSAALSWLAGGEIATDDSDRTGMTSAEPFFLIYSRMPAAPPGVYLHGESGRLRLTMVPEPLLSQLYRALRQLLQERYQL